MEATHREISQFEEPKKESWQVSTSSGIQSFEIPINLEKNPIPEKELGEEPEWQRQRQRC